VSIDTKEVLRIAALAHLELEPASVETLGQQLKQILDHIAVLQELDVSDVPPTTHPLGRGQASRPDEVAPSLSAEDALANAPDAAEGYFRVPRVLRG
jgi:aspartyl-tRNA(Asn)/glutamyl-tRNA(Gln) amidotransferase subunit C